MNSKKAQSGLGVGAIMVTFVVILVGVVLLQLIAQQSGEVTNTVTITDVSLGTMTNGTTTYIDYRLLSDVVISNGTGGDVLTAGNYTVTNNAIDPSDGTLSVGILPASEYTGEVWSINATAQPQTYVGGAANSITGLIAIFFALAIAIVALEPTLRSGVLNMLGK